MPPDSVTEKMTYSWSGHYWLVSLTVLLIVGEVGLGCDRKPDKGGKTSEQKKQQVRDKPTKTQAGAPQKTTDRWQRRQVDRLSGSMKEKLKKAKQAQQKMGGQLKGELTDSLANQSFPETVEFCKSRAPEIAKNVGESLGVSMGRTSHRLRNPDNKPPEWATSAVEQKQKGSHVFRGPDNRDEGTLRELSLLEEATRRRRARYARRTLPGR